MAEALLEPCVIRVCRLVLVLICCSTWLYSTSCWVNWLESIGLVGSWFLSCVVSSVRNVWKLPDSWLKALLLVVLPLALVAVPELPVVLVVGGGVVVGVVVAVAMVMCVFLKP